MKKLEDLNEVELEMFSYLAQYNEAVKKNRKLCEDRCLIQIKRMLREYPELTRKWPLNA